MFTSLASSSRTTTSTVSGWLGSLTKLNINPFFFASFEKSGIFSAASGKVVGVPEVMIFLIEVFPETCFSLRSTATSRAAVFIAPLAARRTAVSVSISSIFNT